MTCKKLIESLNGSMIELHDYMWSIFWLSIAVHLFLGFFIPLMRDFYRALKSAFRRNFQDHADLGTMINRNQAGE